MVDSDNNVLTRIGEMHVANRSLMEGTYIYHVQADSTVSIGFSESGASGSFTVNGSLTVSNSIGSTGTLPRSGAYYNNVIDHMNWEKLHYLGNCTGYQVQGVWLFERYLFHA